MMNLNLHGEHVHYLNPTQNFGVQSARKLALKGRRKCLTKTYAAAHLLPITII
jgi:hypothetical protein